MLGDIQKRKLLIISDTAVFIGGRGNKVYAYEPVMREVRMLATVFDEVIWLASRVTELSPLLTDDKPNNVQIVAMPNVRHNSFNLLHVLIAYPVFVFTIIRYLLNATHVHTRGPSHPAFIGVVFSMLGEKKKYWHKYAGNWTSAMAPFMYRLQRGLLRILKGNNVRVTVNGRAPKDEKHILSFENPCLYEEEREIAELTQKDFSGKLNLLFVGEFTQMKGIDALIQVIETGLPNERVDNIYLIGTGPLWEDIKTRSEKLKHVQMPGAVSRTELNKYYAQAHVIILPSLSEGFPKVVAEAAGFGCIPVVTDISVLSTYVKPGVSGILLKDNTVNTIQDALTRVCNVSESELANMSASAKQMTTVFTYEHYLQRIKEEIFGA